MTAILIFIAILVATVLAVWLVVRSREEPGGRSGVDPERTGDGGAPLGKERREAPGRPGTSEPPRKQDVERLRQEDAERPGSG